MPIAGLVPRFAQVGVIRLGEAKTDPKRPGRKLDTFRVTSPSKTLVERVAGLYGGEVRPWQHPTGPQFEVITNAREIPVYVPPQVIDPNYEQWGNKYKARQCDGATESIRGCPCMCLAGRGGHVHEFVRDVCGCGERRGCKATTRMSLLLAEVMSLGTFKMESHGWNFASEMPMLAAAIASATGPIPGRLELQVREKNVLAIQRDGSEKVEPRKYMVPVVHFDEYTPTEAFGALEGGGRPALNGAQRTAIGSAPVEVTPESAKTAEHFRTLAGLARDPDTIRMLWERAAKVQALDEDLKAYLTDRAKALGAPVKPAPAETESAASPAVPVEVVDAETEPDGKAVWQECVMLAGERGWKMPALVGKFVERMGFDHRDDRATGWALAEFRDALKSGQVA